MKQGSARRVVRHASFARTRPSPALVLLSALLFASLVAPAALRAQSGRQRPAPSASPTPAQRPRRAEPVRDTVDAPGQPSSTNAQTQQSTPAPAAAAKPSPGATPDPDDDEVYKVNSNLVPVSANVTDASGHAIADLKLEDFELRVDGQPQTISDISHAETPVRLALLFDNSSSIRPTRELEKKAAINFFRTVIRPVDQAAIFSISTIPTLDQPLTNEVPRLVRTIENYGEVEGSTALFDTIAMAADYLRPQSGRKVMIVVSDGVETTSNLQDFGEMVRRVLASDCQVFVIQTGLSDNANLRDLVAERRMQDLTSYTGGFVNVPKLPSDLEVAFTQIAADLAQQYVLSYYPNDDGRDGRFRVITLRVKSRPNVRVRARRGYYPRRRENLSTLSPGDTNAAAPYPISDPVVMMPSAASSPREVAQGGAGAVAPNARAPVNLNVPTHGSKNLDPDADASPPADAAPARPVVRLGTFKPEQSPPTAASATTLTTRKPQTDNSQPNPIQNLSSTATDGAAPPVETSQPATPSETTSGSAAPSETRPRSVGDGARETKSASPSAGTQNSSTQNSSQQNSSASNSPASPAPSVSSPKSDEPPRKANEVVQGGVLNSRARFLPVPSYPEIAKRMRASGMVVVEVTIDESGKVIEARAASGPVPLREAAVSAARQARFPPTLVSGQPVRVSGVINYTFTL
ncbi:MAG: VWA domain-containing protein [Pyrinomonadaceae bacterium]